MLICELQDKRDVKDVKGLTVILALLLLALAYGLATYLERKGVLPMQHNTPTLNAEPTEKHAPRPAVRAFDSRLTFHR